MAVAADMCLRCFRLNTAHAKSLADFYEAALGFRRLSLENFSGASMERISPVGGRALQIVLELGGQHIELLEFVDRPGRPYPGATWSSDLVFQHIAIVVADMDAAMRRLSTVDGWSPITSDGPQLLPQSSGGVTAFKFRDPEGHPLELLAFPPGATPGHWRREHGNGPFLGIDHSAISVSDNARSVNFYQSLGLSVASRTINDGPAQAKLDHLDWPLVEVTALTASECNPHLELLCYSERGKRPAIVLRANDIAATCVILGTKEQSLTMARGIGVSSVRQLQDPDGHHLAIHSSTG